MTGLPLNQYSKQLGVQCLAQGPGGELAPLQLAVHTPYCGPCWT